MMQVPPHSAHNDGATYVANLTNRDGELGEQRVHAVREVATRALT
jgi:hypothetical protein